MITIEGLPPAPVRPAKDMSLEHMEAYLKDLEAWRKQVRGIMDAEHEETLDRVLLLRYRRNDPNWKGW